MAKRTMETRVGECRRRRRFSRSARALLWIQVLSSSHLECAVFHNQSCASFVFIWRYSYSIQYSIQPRTLSFLSSSTSFDSTSSHPFAIPDSMVEATEKATDLTTHRGKKRSRIWVSITFNRTMKLLYQIWIERPFSLVSFCAPSSSAPYDTPIPNLFFRAAGGLKNEGDNKSS